MTNDFLNTYSWDTYGRPTTVNAVTVTYDALGRAVEYDKNGTYSHVQYSPTGFKMQIVGVYSTVPMPGENTRLRKLVADLSLDKEALQSVIRKNGWGS